MADTECRNYKVSFLQNGDTGELHSKGTKSDDRMCSTKTNDIKTETHIQENVDNKAGIRNKTSSQGELTPSEKNQNDACPDLSQTSPSEHVLSAGTPRQILDKTSQNGVKEISESFSKSAGLQSVVPAGRGEKDKNKQSKKGKQSRLSKFFFGNKEDRGVKPITRDVDTESDTKLHTVPREPIRVKDKLDMFVYYNHDSPDGKGLCVIFTFFTGDIPSYLEDTASARNVFHNELHYDVKKYVNCNKQDMMMSIAEVQAQIAQKAVKYGKPYYDRFVMIILSHGNEDGFMTNSDKNGFFAEQRNGKNLLTDVNEICNKFKHDDVPYLKGKPKLFLVQACRGFDQLRAAGGGTSGNERDLPQYDLSDIHQQPKIPVDADILVYNAATPNHPSYFCQDNSGSWFIENTLQVFKRHYKTKHVEEMTTLINYLIAEQRGAYKGTEVVQMACKLSTLRMSFYL